MTIGPIGARHGQGVLFHNGRKLSGLIGRPTTTRFSETVRIAFAG